MLNMRSCRVNGLVLSVLGLGGLAAAAGCKGAAGRASAIPTQFVDVTDQVGIKFKHNRGSYQYRDREDGQPKWSKYMPETVGSGCAFLDYDGDGWLDIFLINSMDWPGEKDETSLPKLYRNNHDGTFTDVTRKAGLELETYGMGCCCGDYDNDGDTDLYLTCIGANHLYRNNGDGTFSDVTAQAGVAGRVVDPPYGLTWKWSASCAWVDYDRDGDLDLFVCNYVKWSPETDLWCGHKGGPKQYCAPTNYEGVPSSLYRNNGDGTFTDVSDQTGISKAVGKSFGIAVADYNGDGWPDLAVANDLAPNFLFLNQQGKSFKEQGLEAGMALSATGQMKAGMGIDCADWENRGRFGILIGNFSGEGLSLFENDGHGGFTDVSHQAGMGETSLTFLTFGLFFFDYDLDGWKDAFIANGHIDDLIFYYESDITYEQRMLLFHNRRDGTFQEVGQRCGRPFSYKLVARGAAHADYDNDGDEDILLNWNNGKAMLWRNDGGNRNHWIRLKLRGRRSNRDGIGALVEVTANGVKQRDYLKSGSSFLSDQGLRLTFGLGKAKQADEVKITWPSGVTQRLTSLAADYEHLIVEAEGPT